MAGHPNHNFSLPPKLRAIHEADYPRFSDAEMQRRRAEIAGLLLEAGADHLGFNGYFVFEADDSSPAKGISVLGKASSLEAAFRLIDLWGLRPRRASVSGARPVLSATRS